MQDEPEPESLRDWLQRVMRESEPKVSRRVLEKESGVSRGSLDKILHRQAPKKTPDLGTLARLAKWAGIPVADLIRRVGVDPGEDRPSPDEITQRALGLMLRNPTYREVIEQLLDAPERKIETVRAYLAYLEAQEPGSDLQ